MKALLVQLEKPEDVLKIQDILAEAFRTEKVRDLHDIGCACTSSNCQKHIQTHRLPDGRTGLVFMRGSEFVTGIILDDEGKALLVQKLGGRMEG